MLKDKMKLKNLLIVAVLLLIAVFSFTIIAKYATSVEVHSSSISALKIPHISYKKYRHII